jgi:hypothetical protein
MQNELSFYMQQPRCTLGRKEVVVREGYLAQAAVQLTVMMAEGGVAMVAVGSRWQLL